MELLILTIAALIVGYIVFIVVFPRAIPSDAGERTQKALKQIYEDNQESSVHAESKISMHLSLEEESEFVKGFYNLPFLKELYPKLLQAGMAENAAAMVFFYIGLSVLILLVALTLKLGSIFLIAAPVLAFFMIKRYLERKLQKRNEAFINTFPDVLDMFVRSVKSGFPITTAFKMVAENMEPPASTEFMRVVAELSAGQSVNATLTRLAQRIHEPDVHFFVVVMKVQQETGGNLAEVVSNLSGVIRKRKQLRMKIKALTSEGRTTSYILGGLPLFVLGVMFVLNPEYISVLWTTTMGNVLLGTSLTLIVSCMFVTRRMADIDI